MFLLAALVSLPPKRTFLRGKSIELSIRVPIADKSDVPAAVVRSTTSLPNKACFKGVKIDSSIRNCTALNKPVCLTRSFLASLPSRIFLSGINADSSKRVYTALKKPMSLARSLPTKRCLRGDNTLSS